MPIKPIPHKSIKAIAAYIACIGNFTFKCVRMPILLNQPCFTGLLLSKSSIHVQKWPKLASYASNPFGSARCGRFIVFTQNQLENLTNINMRIDISMILYAIISICIGILPNICIGIGIWVGFKPYQSWKPPVMKMETTSKKLGTGGQYPTMSQVDAPTKKWIFSK